MENKLAEKAMEFFTGFLCQTYRKTFCEDEISGKLVDFARERGLWVSQGKVKKNVIIRKEGTGKYRDASCPVILQAHMDMVCVSKPVVADAFAEGVAPYYPDYPDKNRMMAKSVRYPDVETSLGADNGIGVAAICALLDCGGDIDHPPIIAVITVEEEDGMGGADAMTYEEIAEAAIGLNLKRAKFINIDNGHDGEFCVGCAGALREIITLPVARDGAAPADVDFYTLSVSGLAGGHSGICIHEGRANANILLCDVLRRLAEAGVDVSLFSFEKCGGAPNVIPAFTSAVIAVPSGQKELLITQLSSIEKNLADQYLTTDPGLKIEAAPRREEPAAAPYSINTLSSLLSLVNALPNGVIAWDTNAGGGGEGRFVETSNNLGIIEDFADSVLVTCMTRSSVDTAKYRVADEMKALCAAHGAVFETGSDSPGWVYKKENPLRDLFLKKYMELFKSEAVVLATHAGLECGYFARKLGDIDMIACGAGSTGIHGVEETLYTDTVPKLMRLLAAVLEDYCV
ncbi:MAG: M20/M25/M40 family metallo-hydrolase [Chitinispirillales bacterium]|jgi:dipeptidase D|nr:M20/M25/M40 family metallo-hydrolase [Chitinispirillales bacterium]